MKLLKQLSDGFDGLQFRDRVIAVAAVSAVLGLGGNLLVLKPQLLIIKDYQAKEAVHQGELAKLQQLLLLIKDEETKGIDPLAADRARLEDMRREIKNADGFFATDSASASQVGLLVRNLIRATPGLTLLSVKTVPGAVFYSPPAPPKPKEGVSSELEKVLQQMKKNEPKNEQVALAAKPVYRHAVEVSVKGGYSALLAYMEELKRYPRRIFWSQASLDAKNHREATLKLVLFTLSDQQTPPLN